MPECRLVFTLGHSARPPGGVAAVLSRTGSRVLVDVRRWPRSRRHPWHSREALEAEARSVGAAYLHLPALGGYRRFGRDAPEELRALFNCYESEGFNAYAAYLASSPEALRALEVIAYLADACAAPTVLCSERLPWRCHRKVIADWLALHGYRVVHVIDEGRTLPHWGPRCRLLAGETLK